MAIKNQRAPPIEFPLDHSVPQRDDESDTHWAMKAAVVYWLDANPCFEGTVETEKKVEDLVADVRCNFTQTPARIPRRVVFEVQTSRSEQNVLHRTRRHHRFGYSVFWIFHASAAEERRDAEKDLQEHMTEQVSLGLISLEEKELQLGCPVTPDNYDDPSPKLASNELYVPTHDRKKPAFDHGDFVQGEEQFALISVEDQVYVATQVDNDGQRSLPQPAPWDQREFSRAILTEQIKRIGPVRGPP